MSKPGYHARHIARLVALFAVFAVLAGPAAEPPAKAAPKKPANGMPKDFDDDFIDWLGPHAQAAGVDLRDPKYFVLAGAALPFGISMLWQVLVSDPSYRKGQKLQRQYLTTDAAMKEALVRSHPELAGENLSAQDAAKALAEHSRIGCLSLLWQLGIKPLAGTGATALGSWGFYKLYAFAKAKNVTIEQLKKQIEAEKLAGPLAQIGAEKAKETLARAETLLEPHVPGLTKVLRDSVKAIRADLIEEKVARSRGRDPVENAKEVDNALKTLRDDNLMKQIITDSLITAAPTPKEWAGKSLDERLSLILSRPTTDPMFTSYISGVTDEILHRLLPSILPREKVRERVFETTMRHLSREFTGVLKR